MQVQRKVLDNSREEDEPFWNFKNSIRKKARKKI